jgi:hypothetical protein
MLKNFDELKKELTQLANIINLYKSEAVQLKIVELVFQEQEAGAPPEEPSVASPQRRRVKIAAVASSPQTSPKPKMNSVQKSGKMGSVSVLNRLIGDGFFKTRRSLSAILEHSRSKLAANIKPNDMSGPLARFVRNEKLDREKNKEGQFEYFTK